MRIHRGIEQGTAEWGMLRLGRATASEFHRIITPTKAELSKGCAGYIRELIAERIRGCVPESIDAYTSRDMQHGIDTEPLARAAYQTLRDVDVDRVAFVEADDPFFGCSPDGLIGEDGGLELKCPKLETHIGYMLDPETLVQAYRHQVHACLWMTKRKWWDIASFAPWGGVPMVIVRVEPDDYTDALAECAMQFKAAFDVDWSMIEPQLTRTHALEIVPQDQDQPF